VLWTLALIYHKNVWAQFDAHMGALSLEIVKI
jgi:hypothetical protein